MGKSYYLLITTVLALLVSCQTSNTTVSLQSLLEEMIDRDHIARFPDPPYITKQCSSYDRATVTPDSISWFANWDRSMFIRHEMTGNRHEYVMMDAEGPGAVVRFWMTFGGDYAGKGILRVYLDNDTIPVIEGNPISILGGGKLVGYPLSSSVSDRVDSSMRGHNLYLPIPYSSRCKITYQSGSIMDAGAKTGGECVYYNINYRTYEKGTKVISFSKQHIEQLDSLIGKVLKALTERNVSIDTSKSQFVTANAILEPGKSYKSIIRGAKAITYLGVKVKSADLPQALRSTLLRACFDGETTIWSPVGDFFGTAYQLSPNQTWHSGVKADSSMYCLWVMPFHDQCELTLHNFGKDTLHIHLEYNTKPWAWDNRSMHFGASWREYYNIATGEFKSNEGEGNPFDLNYITLQGQGIYVGDALAVFNTVYAWWGEGDEKVYINGENFPSHIGTGTEDYYGYAWCRPEPFIGHPFIAQPLGNGNFSPGLTVNLRHRGLDAIPFTTRLKFDMEMWHWIRARINFAPVCYWYLKPHGKSNHVNDTSAVARKVVINRNDLISPVIENGKLEGENMVLQSLSNGHFRYQNQQQYGWSGNMQLYWVLSEKDDALELKFVSETEGDYNMTAALTQGPKYGVFSIYLNNKMIASKLSLTGSTLTKQSISLGRVNLRRGNNQLRVVTQSRRTPHMENAFGLDCIDFKIN